MIEYDKQYLTRMIQEDKILDRICKERWGFGYGNDSDFEDFIQRYRGQYGNTVESFSFISANLRKWMARTRLERRRENVGVSSHLDCAS